MYICVHVFVRKIKHLHRYNIQSYQVRISLTQKTCLSRCFGVRNNSSWCLYTCVFLLQNTSSLLNKPYRHVILLYTRICIVFCIHTKHQSMSYLSEKTNFIIPFLSLSFLILALSQSRFSWHLSQKRKNFRTLALRPNSTIKEFVLYKKQKHFFDQNTFFSLLGWPYTTKLTFPKKVTFPKKSVFLTKKGQNPLFPTLYQKKRSEKWHLGFSRKMTFLELFHLEKKARKKSNDFSWQKKSFFYFLKTILYHKTK